jgi:hypothetical protein
MRQQENQAAAMGVEEGLFESLNADQRAIVGYLLEGYEHIYIYYISNEISD